MYIYIYICVCVCIYIYIYMKISYFCFSNYANIPNSPLLMSPLITIPHRTLCHLGKHILYQTSQSNYNICPS